MRNPFLVVIGIPWALGLVVACGDSVELGDAERSVGSMGSGSAGGTTALGGLGAETGSGGTGASNGAITGSGGVAGNGFAGDTGLGAKGAVASCDGYGDPPVDPPTFTIEIVNKASSAIFLGDENVGSCSGPHLFDARLGSGEALALDGGFCAGSCQQVMESGPVSCAPVCTPHGMLQLEPGAIWRGTYQAVSWVQTTLPSHCVGGSSGITGDWGCQRRQPLPPGPITFTSVGYKNFRCGRYCKCVPVEGQCVIYDSLPGEGRREATVTLNTPGPVTLVFSDQP